MQDRECRSTDRHNPQFEQPLPRAIAKLIGGGLRMDKFGFAKASESIEPPTSSEEPDVEYKMFSDKLTVLVNDITIAMNRLGYASYRGKVYKTTHAQITPTPTNVRPGRCSTPWK